MSIDFGVGVSSQADIWTAGQQAAEEAVAHLAGRKPDFTLVFSSVRFADPRLLRGIRSVTGNAPLVGCSDTGGIATDGPRRRSVTVIGLIAADGRLCPALERDIAEDPGAAGERLGRNLRRQQPRHPQALLLFPDGLVSNTTEILGGLDRVLGGVPIAGGAAADDGFFQKTFQYFDDEVLSGAVVGVLLCGAIDVGIGVRHGWIPLGRPRRVTRVSGRVLHELDGRAAVSIYEDYLGLRRSELAEAPLAHVAMAYPLGAAIKGLPEYLLRGAIRAGRGGALICTGDLALGSEVRLMIGGYESALEAAQQAACEAADQIGRDRLRGALVFSSVGRQRMLGSEYQGEIDVIRNALGGSGIRLGGFYGYGELAPAGRDGVSRVARGRNLFHNESVAVVGLA